MTGRYRRHYPLAERNKVIVMPNTSTEMLKEQVTSRPVVISAGDIPSSDKSPSPTTRVPMQTG